MRAGNLAGLLYEIIAQINFAPTRYLNDISSGVLDPAILDGQVGTIPNQKAAEAIVAIVSIHHAVAHI